MCSLVISPCSRDLLVMSLSTITIHCIAVDWHIYSTSGVSKSFIFVEVMLLKKFKNKTPLNITRYTVHKRNHEVKCQVFILCIA